MKKYKWYNKVLHNDQPSKCSSVLHWLSVMLAQVTKNISFLQYPFLSSPSLLDRRSNLNNHPERKEYVIIVSWFELN
jgi:hypothetical protein